MSDRRPHSNLHDKQVLQHIYYFMLLVPLPPWLLPHPRQLRIAGRYWKWILWYHLRSMMENEWFSMRYGWHFRVPRLTTVSCRYSRARKSTLRGWMSERGSRLLQKYASWPTHVTLSLIDSNERVETFSRTFITTTLYDTTTDTSMI